MNDCCVMHAVEFLAVDLVGVQHRGVDERQPLAATEHHRFTRTADPRQHVEDPAAPRRRSAGYPDGQRVRNEGLGCRTDLSWHPVRTDPLDMRDDLSTTGSCIAVRP